MKREMKMNYESPISETIEMLSVEAFAASPLDDYHDDNPGGDEGWDDDEN